MAFLSPQSAIYFWVLVQKLQFTYKQSLKFGHTDTTNLKRMCIGMKKPVEFKWKHYQPDIILLTVRWYLRYSLSFRDLVEIMDERGLSMAQPRLCVGFINMDQN